jgi:hypothetical protein
MPGMHYDETFARIARTETWKLILLLALYDQWEIERWDVEAAYLNAPSVILYMSKINKQVDLDKFGA